MFKLWYILEKEMAMHSSIPAWEIPWIKEPGRLQSMGVARVRHKLVTKSPPTYTYIYAYVYTYIHIYTIYTYIYLSRFAVQQKVTQQCKSTALQ